MPHQCVHCSSIYPDAAEELLKGCTCGSKFFFYIRRENLNKADEKLPVELNERDKISMEKDVREIMHMEDEEQPVILDLESIRVISPGKFQIDIVNLFSGKRPVIYRLEEGKYIVDLASSFNNKSFKQ